MEKSQALSALQALAHEDRLEVMHLLIAHCKPGLGKPGLAAGDIGRQLGLAPSRLSFHLAVLESAGLIGSQKVARNVIYQARTNEIGGLMGWLLRDCCGGDPHVLACCADAQAKCRPADRPADPSYGQLPAGNVKT